jgi:hypothetical protein
MQPMAPADAHRVAGADGNSHSRRGFFPGFDARPRGTGSHAGAGASRYTHRDSRRCDADRAERP